MTELTNVPLTALLSPLRESLSHLRKSIDGATTSSGCDDTGAGLAAPGVPETARTALPFTRGAEPGAGVEGEMAGRGTATAVAEVFPFAPTTVQALF
jgi:hypothetical protein